MTRVLSILATVVASMFLLPALAAHADEVQLLFHQQVVDGYEVLHASSLLQPSPPPPGQPSPPPPEDQALHDAVQWMLNKNILDQTEVEALSFEVTITAEGIVIYSSWGGGNLVIILSNGPFFPQPVPRDWLINFQMVRSIYNGI